MSCRLRIEIVSYWHPGTGRGQGSYLDATTHRNARGLPALPGRTVKGLLRNAVHRWEVFGGYPDVPADAASVADQLFGPYGREGAKTWPGLLRFSDAALPKDEAAYLSEHRDLAQGLYRSHFSTGIEHETGTAREKTLRGIEMVVPLTLYAQVHIVLGARYADLASRWPELVKMALPLVQGVGARRSRGLGRAVLTLEGAS